MLDGELRRNKLMEILTESHQPVSGGALAKTLGVSRQVIVQDIALLRAVHQNIMATTRGYILYSNDNPNFHRTYWVNHNDEAIEDELNTMVDNGGKVLDVVVEHEVYGQISANLILENRSDVANFCQLLKSSGSKPLNLIAGGPHYHTVEARSEVILDNIERALKEKGYLIS